MHIGLDFDNTIICYDYLFHRVALERDLIPSSVPAFKTAVRDFLRASGREKEWTRLQGLVYGPLMMNAEPFPGVKEFLAACSAAGVVVSIVSHKTKTPASGEPYDLHATARNWMEAKSLIGHGVAGLNDDRIYFEPDRRQKAERICRLKCTHFIDDLPEFLDEPFLPSGVVWILFDPNEELPRVRDNVMCLRSWAQAKAWLYGIRSKEGAL